MTFSDNGMDTAIQTISWGRDISRLIGDLPRLADIGYLGLELAQSSFDVATIEDFFQVVEKCQLQIVGVAGGSIEDKVEMVAKIGTVLPDDTPPYIYMDHWNLKLEERFILKKRSIGYSGDIQVAIHPHMFKPVQTGDDLRSVLEQFEFLKFLPDTAHLTVAGENVLELVKRYQDRLVGIHLKNWLPAYGRSFQFYSKGFCELDDENGIVRFQEIVDALRDRTQGSWIIEQDYSTNPIDSARKSYEWLSHELGV